MWGPFWGAFTAADFEAHKTLAHATPADVEAGRTTQWERRANGHADEMAKRGAGLHDLGTEDEELWKGLEALAEEAARWSATLEASLTDQGRLDHEDVLRGKQKGAPGPSTEERAPWPRRRSTSTRR